MKNILFLFLLFSIFYCQDKNDDKTLQRDIHDFYKQLRLTYYQRAGLKIDSTRYSLVDKENRIESFYQNSDYNGLSQLYLFDSDTMLPQSAIKKWIQALYFEQHYRLISLTFAIHYPTNYHVLMSMYKIKNYSTFLNSLDNIKVKNISTHLAKLDAKYKLKRYEEIVTDTMFLDRNAIPLQLRQIHIRANYKLKNYSAIINQFSKIGSEELTPEITFIGAQAYLRLKEYEISDYFFNVYINAVKKSELAELQLALYYQGLSQLEQGKMNEAESFFEEAISLNPKYTNLKAFIHHTLGGYYQENKMYEKSLEQWIKYLALLPEKHSDRNHIIEKIEILREKAFLHKKSK